MRLLLYICVHAFAASIAMELIALMFGGAILFPALFLGLWLVVLFLLSSNWRPLHAAFPMRPDRMRKRYYMLKAGMGACHYSLNVTVGDAGLTLAAIPMFRLFHPPVHVPWSEVDVCFPDAGSTLLVFKRGDLPDLYLGTRIDIEGRATDIKETQSQWPTGWCEAAPYGRSFILGASMYSIFLPVQAAILIAIGFVVTDPAPAKLIEAAWIIPATTIFIWVFFSPVFISSALKFHARLLDCIETEPIARDPTDAQEAQWCLEHFRWAQRLICWMRGRDYRAMIAGCERAQVPDPDRPLPQPRQWDSPSLFGYCCDFWREATQKSQQQMNGVPGRKRCSDDESKQDGPLTLRAAPPKIDGIPSISVL